MNVQFQYMEKIVNLLNPPIRHQHLKARVKNEPQVWLVCSYTTEGQLTTQFFLLPKSILYASHPH